MIVLDYKTSEQQNLESGSCLIGKVYDEVFREYRQMNGRQSEPMRRMTAMVFSLPGTVFVANVYCSPPMLSINNFVS